MTEFLKSLNNILKTLISGLINVLIILLIFSPTLLLKIAPFGRVYCQDLSAQDLYPNGTNMEEIVKIVQDLGIKGFTTLPKSTTTSTKSIEETSTTIKDTTTTTHSTTRIIFETTTTSIPSSLINNFTQSTKLTTITTPSTTSSTTETTTTILTTLPENETNLTTLTTLVEFETTTTTFTAREEEVFIDTKLEVSDTSPQPEETTELIKQTLSISSTIDQNPQILQAQQDMNTSIFHLISKVKDLQNQLNNQQNPNATLITEIITTTTTTQAQIPIRTYNRTHVKISLDRRLIPRDEPETGATGKPGDSVETLEGPASNSGEKPQNPEVNYENDILKQVNKINKACDQMIVKLNALKERRVIPRAYQETPRFYYAVAPVIDSQYELLAVCKQEDPRSHLYSIESEEDITDLDVINGLATSTIWLDITTLPSGQLVYGHNRAALLNFRLSLQEVLRAPVTLPSNHCVGFDTVEKQYLIEHCYSSLSGICRIDKTNELENERQLRANIDELTLYLDQNKITESEKASLTLRMESFPSGKCNSSWPTLSMSKTLGLIHPTENIYHTVYKTYSHAKEITEQLLNDITIFRDLIESSDFLGAVSKYFKFPNPSKLVYQQGKKGILCPNYQKRLPPKPTLRNVVKITHKPTVKSVTPSILDSYQPVTFLPTPIDSPAVPISFKEWLQYYWETMIYEIKFLWEEATTQEAWETFYENFVIALFIFTPLACGIYAVTRVVLQDKTLKKVTEQFEAFEMIPFYKSDSKDEDEDDSDQEVHEKDVTFDTIAHVRTFIRQDPSDSSIDSYPSPQINRNLKN